MLRFATTGLVLLACTLSVSAQGGTGPDVIVGDIYEIQAWGAFNQITAFSIGTESCNIGTQNLTWDQNTNLHPAITGNMYRMKDGRFEQIGMSWVKHGFYALSNTLCGSCPNGSPTGFYLGVGCSDPYSANLNGTQGLLGPRNEVNPHTGYFPYPVAGIYPLPQVTIGERLQVLNSDLAPASNVGAVYFVQGHYVHQEDSTAGNQNNNASYRHITISPSGQTYTAQVVDTTQQMKPAMQAWQDNDPLVQIKTIDIPNDGRILVGYKSTPLANGLFHYEYAVQNLNADRGIGSFKVELWPGANLTNIGFHSAPYHSGEIYSNTAWTSSISPGSLFPGSITWSSATYGQDPNASALRWGNLYNFRFDSDQLPGNVTLGMFKPGSPSTMAVPSFCAPKRPAPGAAVPYVLNTSAGYDFVNISGGSLGPVGDDAALTVNLPFAFPFYGQPQTQIVISTNGYLTLAGQDGTLSSNTTLPSASLPTGMIAGYWDDLTTTNPFGDIRYQYIGGRFVVYWNVVHLTNQSLPVQFEVILEPSGSIVSTIVQCPGSPYGGVTATRGIESYNGTAGLLYSFNTPNSALSNTTIRYDVASAVPATSNLYYSGSLGGGMFRLVYVSAPNTPILTVASLGQGPLNLGALGSLPIDLITAVGVSDYFGLMTGFPNAAAVTDGPCGQNVLQFWVNPGAVPSGTTAYLVGIDWQNFPNPPPATVPNGSFNISNGLAIVSP